VNATASDFTLDRASRFYVTLGAGISSQEFLGMASATLALRGWQLSARALIADGLDFAVSPTESVAEVGLLVGRTWHAGSTSIYAQAGPIRASTVTRGKFLYQEDSAFETKVYEEIDRQNLGLGLEAGSPRTARSAASASPWWPI
jgi:hypothetical protein